MKTLVLLVPGILNTAAVWDEVLARLPEDAIVKVADVTKDETVRGMAQRAWEAISDVSVTGHRLVLCGFSLGGYVALEMLSKPQRPIDGLLLISTSARAETEQGLVAREKSVGFLRKAFDQAIDGIVQFGTGPEFRSDTARADNFRRMMRSFDAETAIRQNRAAAGRADHRALMRALTIPTSIVAGELDRVTPPELSEELSSLTPDAELTVFKGAGHVLPLERSEEVARILVGLIARLKSSRKETE